MIAAEHDGERARREDVADATGDLVEALFEVGGDGEDVAGVAERHLFAKVDAELVVIGRVEGRDAADTLRPEAGSGPIGGAGIEGDAEDRRVILADVADVLDIGRLEKRVDAGEVGKLAAGEGRDGLVGQRFRPGQAHVERPLLLAPPAVHRKPAFGLDRLPAAGFAGVEVGMMVSGALRRGDEAGIAPAPLAGDVVGHGLGASAVVSLLRMERVVSSACAAAVACSAMGLAVRPFRVSGRS